MTYGNVNVDTVTTSTPNGILGAGNASIMKNRIINGAMVIDQRNAGASVTNIAGAVYTLDRWALQSNQASKLTIQQSSTAPTGFVNSTKITSSSAYSIGASDYFIFSQVIEGFNIADLGWGTANAKTVTLSFQVQSSLTGTFGGSLTNGSRSYPFSYTISSANTWTPISVTVAGDTNGTWATNNTAGISVYFGLGVGTTYSTTAGAWAAGNYLSATGATSVVGTSGATFYITGVQLEVGSSATGFEYRQYQQELALCQRYYWNGTVIFNASLSTYGYPSWNFPVQMRASPTIAISSGGGGGAVAALGTNGFYQSGGATSAGSSTVLTSTAEL